jgi:hypothetical protein
VTPNKKLARTRPQNSATKITTKSFENHEKGGREKATQELEEPRRIIYTYHEGSYKVELATHTFIPLSRSHMKLSS